MFDVRPVTDVGDLDMHKISASQRILRLEPKKQSRPAAINDGARNFHDIRKVVGTRRPQMIKEELEANVGPRRLMIADESENMPIACRSTVSDNKPIREEIFLSDAGNVGSFNLEFGQKSDSDNEIFQEEAADVSKKPEPRKIGLKDVFGAGGYRKFAFPFSAAAVIIFTLIAGTNFFNKGMKAKDSIMSSGQDAYVSLAMAKEGIFAHDFQKSSIGFEQAHGKFEEISKDIDDLGGILVEPSRFVPFFSKISSGGHMAQAGKDISRIGILAGEIMQSLDGVKNPLAEGGDSISFLKIFQNTDKNLKEIVPLLESVEDNLSKVNIDDIPEEKRAQFVELKSKLPGIRNFISSFVSNNEIFIEVLGGNGPRKYLFLFQNNQEMRATGGFIGTYGVMDIFDGHVRKFFIDGIFNPDGQLREKIIPPSPIQKISAAWSLHDSNWFPDFPKSAEKAAWFYEKTGGPTVDGVITMTPVVLQELMAITGPIEMPEYGVTVDKDNFIEVIQQEVEIDYDKDLNQPKKILADLAPKIMENIFNAKNFSDMARTANILLKSLDEKQILIYSKNYEIEKVLSAQGWSGEILDTQKDYVSVINTNINGFKTDGVIDETIEHQAEIGADGTVVDTVTVTRHHNGGNAEKDWWNKVNANYMRVYVPKGSILISAEGQTREFNSPPLDYKVLGFKADAQVQMEEESIRIDEESGTRVYEDGDKTVFANWTYVSPQETMVMKYKYQLPFKLEMNATDRPADTYSLLAQKQSGSSGSKFVSEVIYADSYDMIWSYPQEISKNGNTLRMETDLKTDKFLGTAFMNK